MLLVRYALSCHHIAFVDQYNGISGECVLIHLLSITISRLNEQEFMIDPTASFGCVAVAVVCGCLSFESVVWESGMRQSRVADKMDRTVKKGLNATQRAVQKFVKSVPKREISLVNSIKGLTGEKHFFEESISVSFRAIFVDHDAHFQIFWR